MASNSSSISEAEAALYDRQIRLWGLEAQKRLRASSVLFIGLKGLGAEVCKNVVLSGINSITLMDHNTVTEEDFCSNFLISSREDIGKNRAASSVERTQELNPNVIVKSDNDNPDNKPDIFFEQFDVVCATCCPRATIFRLNNICHGKNIKFFAGDVFGFYGYMFADLNDHEFVEEKAKMIEKEDSNGVKKLVADDTETVVTKKTFSYCRFKDALDVDWSTEKYAKALKRASDVYFIMQILLMFREQFGRDPQPGNLENDRTELQRLREEVLDALKVKSDPVDDNFSGHCAAELSPICAIVGGVMGQEIIKAVSCRDVPHNNFFFFNGLNSTGIVDCIGS
ncbi:SUMO-activating enzyme subunit 1-like [Antedon mediterranea]|uniref:SUMO-activating enzyme subunit 1-like n=1 Tax=Antedon mediterranea TaxID=105859 RepID=UPI003AF517A7